MFSVDLNCHFIAICPNNTLQLLPIRVQHTISYQRVLLNIPPPIMPICPYHKMTNPLTPTVAICMGTAIKHLVPDRVEPSLVIFDIRALWRSCRLNPVWYRMLYSCAHMVTVSVKGLIYCSDIQAVTDDAAPPPFSLWEPSPNHPIVLL